MVSNENITFQDDEKQLMKMLNESVWRILRADTDLWRIYEGRSNISVMMGFKEEGRSSRLVDFLRFCTGRSSAHGNNPEPFTSMATSVTLESSVTFRTSVTLEPYLTSEPSVTLKPPLTSVSTVTLEPSLTSESTVTLEPSLTSETSVTLEPYLTSEPSATLKPPLTSVSTVTLEPSLTSETSVTLEESLTFETSVTLEESLTFESSVTLEQSLTSETSLTLEPSFTFEFSMILEQSLTFEPYLTFESSVTLEPSVTTDSSMTSEPVVNQSSTINMTASEETQTQLEEEEFPWFNVTSLDQCNEAYDELLDYVDSRIVDPFSDFRHESITFFDAADAVDEYLSPDCLALVEEGRQLKNAFSDEFEWVYNARDGLEAGLYAAERLLERYVELTTPSSLYEGFDARLMELCTWRTEFAVTFQEKGTRFIQNIGKARDSVRRAEPLLRRWAEHLYAIGVHGAFPIQGIMGQYLNASVR